MLEKISLGTQMLSVSAGRKLLWCTSSFRFLNLTRGSNHFSVRTNCTWKYPPTSLEECNLCFCLDISRAHLMSMILEMERLTLTSALFCSSRLRAATFSSRGGGTKDFW